jgi:hypothetical protein
MQVANLPEQYEARIAALENCGQRASVLSIKSIGRFPSIR